MPAPSTRRPQRRGVAILAGAGLALGLTVGGIGFLLAHHEQSSRQAAERQTAELRLAEAQAERARQIAEERGAILELVREYRPTASEGWQRRLAEAIYAESKAAQVDPLIIASIVAQESSFMSRARSHVGAVGLMQLRPWVAADVAARASLDWQGEATLHDPEQNVRLGVLYYKELVARFEGDLERALTAYNQGPTRVRRDIASGRYDGSLYADDVLGLYEALRDD